MTATSTSVEGVGNAREEVCPSGIADALSWRHVLETNDYEQNPDYKRPGLRIVVYPEFLTKLGLVLASGNLGMDPCDERLPAY
jgi:hypothetical protein